jgi:hypothetical protein
VKFEVEPLGATVACTLGLSDHRLASRRSGAPIRYEILFAVHQKYGSSGFNGVLDDLGRESLKAHSAFFRGDVVGPRGPVIPGSRLRAIYLMPPVCFPDSFATCEIEDGHRVAIVWAVPISAAEAAYVRNHGWQAFEEQLASVSPDLLDLMRDSIVPDSGREGE